jgi:hypothetical protein
VNEEKAMTPEETLRVELEAMFREFYADRETGRQQPKRGVSERFPVRGPTTTTRRSTTSECS